MRVTSSSSSRIDCEIPCMRVRANNLLNAHPKRLVPNMFHKTYTHNTIFHRLGFQRTMKGFEHATPIDSRVYYDDEVFEKEKQNLFTKEWIALSTINGLVEGNATVIVANILLQSLLITKSDNTINVFLNNCEHRGCQLLTANTDERYIECPYHRWTYGLDGQANHIPTDSSNEAREVRLSQVSSMLYNNIVLGRLNKYVTTPPISLSDALSFMQPYDLVTEVHVLNTFSRVVKANWKIIIENCMDINRLPTIHPLLSRNLPVRDFRYLTASNDLGVGYVVENGMNSSLPIDFDRDKNFSKKVGSARNDADNIDVHFRFVFPNLFVILFPHHMVTVVVNPLDAHNTNVTVNVMAKITHDVVWKRELVDFYETMMLRDFFICEMLHASRNTRMHALEGKYDKTHDRMLHSFHKRMIGYYVS